MVAVLQFAALAIAIVVPFLLDSGYRFYDAEVLVLAAAALFAALPVAWAAARSRIIGRLAFAVLAYWVVDLYFIESDFAAYATLAGFTVAVCTRFEQDIRNICALFAALFTIICVFSPAGAALVPPLPIETAAAPSDSSELPLVVHFILDEQGSPLTASAELRASGRLDRLLAAYTERGFATHTWVRASAGATQRSLGLEFGLDDAPVPNWAKGENGFTYRLSRNRYVDALLEHGFEVTVVQNSFLQLCVAAQAHCHTYPRAIHGHSMTRFADQLPERLRLALMLLHAEQYSTDSVRHVALYKPIGIALVEQGGWPRKRQFWTRPATVLEVLDNLERRVDTMRPGEIYLIHLLAPHFPYVLDSMCELKQAQRWAAPIWADAGGWTDLTLADIERAYWDQAECLHSRLLRIVDAIDHAIGRDRTVIILHGDHGARLRRKSARPTDAQLSAAQPDGSLDTVFLHRVPGAAPGVDGRRVMLGDLLRDTAAHIAPGILLEAADNR